MSADRNHLFSNFVLGKHQLKNRVVMAPMTRCRCIDNMPNELVAKYYAQRAEAGLIITEGTSPSDNGLGYARIPGLYTSEHVHAWEKVTRAVHEAGSKIFVQLMHCGRVAHPDNLPSGMEILAPSPIAVEGEMWTDQNGMQKYPEPEEMTESDIHATIEEYVHSADLAMKAGFDGVELHGANGYLIDQFLNPASNKRMDNWGGALGNRVKFAIEVVKQVAHKIGPEQVGIRLSPYGTMNGMEIHSHVDDQFELLAQEFQKLGILYIHLIDQGPMGGGVMKESIKEKIRKAFKGTLILSGGYDHRKAEQDLKEKKADLFAFGRAWIANPKLVSRMKNHHQIHPADQTSFYTPGEKGYTDYSAES